MSWWEGGEECESFCVESLCCLDHFPGPFFDGARSVCSTALESQSSLEGCLVRFVGLLWLIALEVPMMPT